MKESLAKPLAITTSLLMLPILGIVLVFGPATVQDSDVSLLDVGSHVSVPTAAQESATREAVVAPPSRRALPAREAPVAPRPAARSIPAPREMTPATPQRDGRPLLLLNRLEIELADVDTSPEETQRLLARMRERTRLMETASSIREWETSNAHGLATRSVNAETFGWSPTATEVEASLARRDREVASNREAVFATLRTNSNPRSVHELADLARVCYERGTPDLAEDLGRSSSLLVAWNQSRDLSVTGRFDRRGFGGGDLELTIVRHENLHRPLAVSFPPGTYGESVSRAQGGRSSRIFPKAQDLAFLRAPIVILEAGQSRATLEVPVACASYGVHSPEDDHPYELTQFRRGSKVSKLMVALCAGEQKDDSEAQLAVWIARNDLRRNDFLSRGRGLRTFHRYHAIGAEHFQGAARQLLDAGLNPHETPFFPAPPAPTRATPQPTPPTPAAAPTPRGVPTPVEVDVVG